MALVFLAGSPEAYAAEPQQWVVDSFMDLLAGDLEAVETGEGGELQLGFEFVKIGELQMPQVWATAADPRDGGLFVSGGDQGEIWKVPAKGAPTRIHKSSEPFVYALTASPSAAIPGAAGTVRPPGTGSDGDLYFGTSPNGKVYRLRGSSTTAEEVMDPAELYIWSLAAGADGSVYVGTGSPARVYRIDPNGKSQTVFEGKEDHVSSILLQTDGSILVGCSGKARVYRVPAKGKRTVMVDSKKDEVRAITQSNDGTLYVSLIGSQSSSSLGSKATNTADKEREAEDVQNILGEPSPSEPKKKGGIAPRLSSKKNEVVAIDAEGFVFSLWEGDETPFALQAAGDAVQIGLGGTKARILMISGKERRKSLVYQGAEEETVALLGEPGKAGSTLLVTSHPSVIYRWDAQRAGKGAYYSEPFDADRVSYWGRLDWKTRPPRIEKGVRFLVRSGNTATPNTDWTEWKGLKDGQAGLPPSRYFQWKVEFERTPSPPVLLQVTTHYLGKNSAPQVQGLTVKEVRKPGGARQAASRQAAAGPQPGAPSTQPSFPVGGAPGMPQQGEAEKAGFLDLSWKGTDPEGDPLVFDLSFRAQDESTWKELQKDWGRTTFRWDISAVPDGVYFVKITASDRQANPRTDAREESIVSSPIDVDNTPPRIREVKHSIGSDGVRIEFEAYDPVTPVDTAEIALDAAEWELVYPVDRIADSSTEKFVVTLPGVGEGEHTVVIKVSDQKENTATERIVFVKGK